jgi:hypothetical protein
MARFSSYIIGPLILINLAGIITIVSVEQSNMSNSNPYRRLSYNEYHNNLRGSKKLKIQINENKDFEMIKPINENNNSPIELRKLSTTSSSLEINYIFIINLIPLAFCLLLIFSFCAEEDGTCECCDSLNEDTYYERTSYEHGYVNYHREYHRPRAFIPFNISSSGRRSNHNKSDEDKKNEAAGFLIVLICILIIILVLMIFLIPRACGKTATRYFALGFLSLFYLGMTALYSIKLFEGDYNNINALFAVSLSLLLCNFVSIFIPTCVNACRSHKGNNLNNKSVETPLYAQELQS